MRKKLLLQQTNGHATQVGKPAGKSRLERLKELETEIQLLAEQEKLPAKRRKRRKNRKKIEPRETRTGKNTLIKSLVGNAQKTSQNIRSIIALTGKVKKQKSQLEDITEEIEDSVKKLKMIQEKHDHFAEVYQGLEEIKKIDPAKDIDAESKILAIYRREIDRLEGIVSKQREAIDEKILTTPLSQLEYPKFAKTLHPVRFIKRYKKYKREVKEFKEKINKERAGQVSLQLAKEKINVKVKNKGNLQFKPEMMKNSHSYIQMGDKYVRTYYLADVPAILTNYVLFKLVTSPLPFSLSIYFELSDTTELIKQARQHLSALESKQGRRMESGKLRDPHVDKGMEETGQFIEELVHEVEKGVLYSFYLTLEADTKEELLRLHKELKNETDAMEFVLNTYIFSQKKAYETMLPFNQEQIKRKDHLLSSTMVSYLMPFVTKQIYDPDGIFLGINAYHDSLVFLNPFTSRNNNVNILGVSGAGKSVTAKVLATRLYARGTQIIIIDPEGEYVDFAKSLGGEVIQFSRENGINPFRLTTTTTEEVLNHILMLKTFFKNFIPQDKYDGAILDDALVSLYEKGTPDFPGLLKSLEKSAMYDYLRVLNTGSLKGIFNSQREIELTNELLVFDISTLGNTEAKTPAMYLLTSLIWQIVNQATDRKRMLFIDEAHNLLVDEEVAIFYRKIVKDARKRQLGVVSITQDVEDFLDHELGKAIINNSETKILLKQPYAALDLMKNIFPMSDEERAQLGNLGVGEAVMFRENEHIRFDVMVLPSEEKFVFSNRFVKEDPLDD